MQRDTKLSPLTTPAIVLITGVMAAGKSTVAQALAERLPRSVHLRGDLFRRMIVNGQVPMGYELNEEALAQLNLRYAIATTVVPMYLAGGFTVVYQDIIIGETLQTLVDQLRAHPLYVVVLCPSATAVSQREAVRDKRGYGSAAEIAAFDRVLRAETPRIGLWLDTTDLSIDETVAQILNNLTAAAVTT
ncbi:MAG: AAA family ATPase [Caldilineaceae bacterium]|nr:AAA family ATPase [Caldilineaceae bacterium]